MDRETNEGVIRVEVNCAYLSAWAAMLMIQDAERRLTAQGEGMKHEKKMWFSRFRAKVKELWDIHGKLDEDVWKSAYNERTGSYGAIDSFLRDANELARLILTFADRASTSQEAVDEVFALLRSRVGEGLMPDEALDFFDLDRFKKK